MRVSFKQALTLFVGRFDNWSTLRKSWSAKGSNNYAVKNTRMHSVNVYGVFGQAMQQPLFQFSDGCRWEKLFEFIPKMVEACQVLRGNMKPVLVVD